MQVRYSLILVAYWALSGVYVGADSAFVVNAIHIVSTTGAAHSSSTARATLDSTTVVNGRVVESVHRGTTATTPYIPRTGTTTRVEYSKTPSITQRDDIEPINQDVPYVPDNVDTITNNNTEPSTIVLESIESMDLAYAVRTVGTLVRTLLSYAVSNLFF